MVEAASIPAVLPLCECVAAGEEMGSRGDVEECMSSLLAGEEEVEMLRRMGELALLVEDEKVGWLWSVVTRRVCELVGDDDDDDDCMMVVDMEDHDKEMVNEEIGDEETGHEEVGHEEIDNRDINDDVNKDQETNDDMNNDDKTNDDMANDQKTNNDMTNDDMANDQKTNNDMTNNDMTNNKETTDQETIDKITIDITTINKDTLANKDPNNTLPLWLSLLQTLLSRQPALLASLSLPRLLPALLSRHLPSPALALFFYAVQNSPFFRPLPSRPSLLRRPAASLGPTRRYPRGSRLTTPSSSGSSLSCLQQRPRGFPAMGGLREPAAAR